MNMQQNNPLAYLLQQFDAATPGGTGIGPLDGNYQFEVVSCENKTHPQAGYLFFSTTLKVLWSDTAHGPGTVLDWNVWMKNPQFNATYVRDVRKFIFNAWKGAFPELVWEQITGNHWVQACEAAQPLRGKFIAGTFFTRPNKKSQGDFQTASWQPWRGPGFDVMPAVNTDDDNAGQTHVQPMQMPQAQVQAPQNFAPVPQVQQQMPQMGGGFAGQAQASVAQQQNPFAGQLQGQQVQPAPNPFQQQAQPAPNPFQQQAQPAPNPFQQPNPGFVTPQQPMPQNWQPQPGQQQQQPNFASQPNPFGGQPAPAPNSPFPTGR